MGKGEREGERGIRLMNGVRNGRREHNGDKRHKQIKKGKDECWTTTSSLTKMEDMKTLSRLLSGHLENKNNLITIGNNLVTIHVRLDAH